MKTIQFFMTPGAGKALIAKALLQREDIHDAMMSHTVVITAGTTNTYVAREALHLLGSDAMDAMGFYRGTVRPAGAAGTQPVFGGDVVIRQGKWLETTVIQDVVEELGREDIVIKGANAVHLPTGEPGVLIGNPAYGTMVPVTAAVLGRGARLIVPVGVEKRVDRPIFELLRMTNAAPGLRLSSMPGLAYTELDAFAQMGAQDAAILSSGGICGYEGGCYFGCTGSEDALQTIQAAVGEAMKAPAFVI